MKAFLTLTNCNNTYFLIWVGVLVFNGTFKKYFCYIVAVTCICGATLGTRRKQPTCPYARPQRPLLYLLCAMCYLRFVCLLWKITLCDSIWPCRWIYLVLVKYIHLSCFNVFGEWVNEWVTYLFQSQLNNFSALSWRE